MGKGHPPIRSHSITMLHAQLRHGRMLTDGHLQEASWLLTGKLVANSSKFLFSSDIPRLTSLRKKITAQTGTDDLTLRHGWKRDGSSHCLRSNRMLLPLVLSSGSVQSANIHLVRQFASVCDVPLMANEFAIQQKNCRDRLARAHPALICHQLYWMKTKLFKLSCTHA